VAPGQPQPSHGGGEDLQVIPDHRDWCRKQPLDAGRAVVRIVGIDELEALERLSFIPRRTVEAEGRPDTPRLPFECVIAKKRRGLDLLEQRLTDTLVAREPAPPPPVLPGHILETVAPYATTDG
jgi:hypothetical protein